MSLLRNILDIGVKDEMREDEKRRISLTNAISLILAGALFFQYFFRLFLTDLSAPRVWVVLTVLVVFLSPIILNYFNKIDTSRIFLSYAPLAIFWIGAAIRLTLNATTTNVVFIYDGLRIFILALSFIPYLVYDHKRPWLLVVTVLPTLVSIVFYDYIFMFLTGDNPSLIGTQPLETSFTNIRWIIGYGVVSAACFTFRKIIDKADEEKAMLISKLEGQTEEIVAQNEQLEKLSIVANKSTNAIAIFDKYGNFEWVNSGFVELYDQTIEELLANEGTNLFDTIPKSYLTEEGSKPNSAEVESILKKLKKCIEQKKPVHYEYYTITKSGDQIIVQTTLSPILDKDGEIKQLVAIDTDISKLKKAEKEITKQKDEIMEQAHELRKRNQAIEKQSEKLKMLYEEIKSISDNQEIIIEERTRQITAQNEKIIKYAFMNAHKLRGPVARILGLIYLCKHENSDVDFPEMFTLIDNEVAELDQIVKEINDILAEEGLTDYDS